MFSFNPLRPHPLLAPYVAKMWVFESSGRLPELDRKLIVPNANFKLAYTYSNGLVANVAGNTFVQKEHSLTLTGMVDTPVNLNPTEDAATSTIVVEFNPRGVYRLFRLSFADVKNQILEVADLLPGGIRDLQTQLADAGSMDHRIQLLQKFLIGQLSLTDPDTIFEYCVQRIGESQGLVSVARLEKETGYSARWLHKKFLERLGTAPKNFSEIIRFRQCYEAYSTGGSLQALKDSIYQHYYDQAHFIRAFKRFTGCTPTDLHNSSNELATKHYTS